jgi:hypothetical protein
MSDDVASKLAAARTILGEIGKEGYQLYLSEVSKIKFYLL